MDASWPITGHLDKPVAAGRSGHRYASFPIQRRELHGHLLFGKGRFYRHLQTEIGYRYGPLDRIGRAGAGACTPVQDLHVEIAGLQVVEVSVSEAIKRPEAVFARLEK